MVPTIVPWLAWLSLFLPIVIAGLTESKVAELIWIALLVPTGLFAYYRGLRGGLAITLFGTLLHGSWEWIDRFPRSQNLSEWHWTLEIFFLQLLVALCVGLFSDKLQRQQRELEQAMFRDSLTGLSNRRYLQDRMKQAVQDVAAKPRPGRQHALLLLDLDRFQRINNTLGLRAGDRLLQEAAQRIRAGIRQPDLVARFGGDEFTVLLLDLERSEAEAVAERLVTRLRAPFRIEGQDVYLSATIGIALFPADAADAETWLRNAETAMHRAKEQVNNQPWLFFSPSMHDRIIERLQMERDLRRALERDEFRVYYQPRVDLHAGIIGMEALVRWEHPTKGLIPPASFIPLAEETGLIVPIGESVLRKACLQTRIWQEAGHRDLRLAVNLSARQFQDPHLRHRIRTVLAETGLAAEWLELEITESTVMNDLEATVHTLKQLKELGVHISIDDFGTGYSSLSYLKRFPLDTLKIDRSFVRDIPDDQDDAAIAGMVITLAHALKLEVIAEGVETAEQAAFLRDQSCSVMQGYLFSPPVPTEQFEQLLIDRRHTIAC
jgi:diguanylate cyclase (GGDEF)-like protein